MIPNKVYSMIEMYLPTMILFTLVSILLRVVYVIYGRKDINVHNELKRLVYILYCFSLFILVTSNDFSSYSNNFIPFKEITRYSLDNILFYRNVIGNILLFIPFGILITDLIKENCKKCNFIIPILITLLTSGSIEFIQMTIGRAFDIDDIILNTIGSLFGYILYYIAISIFKKINKSRYSFIIRSVLVLIGIMLFALILLLLYGVI